jgi:magnesium-transporting ATPase (P-type)
MAPSGSRPAETPAWHAVPAEEVLEHLGSSRHGLTADVARARVLELGPNQLEADPPTPWWKVFARQFVSPLIAILAIAAMVTLILEEYLDAAVIAVVLALNAVIGFVQERRAEGAVRALSGLLVPRALVVRDGRDWDVDSRELVPGDVVVLEPGARVPADLRLVSALALQVDESLLTGESKTVTKQVDPVAARAVLADRSSMAFTGSVVTGGRGRGVAVATGMSTELGAIAELVRTSQDTETPLQHRMRRFAVTIGVAVSAASMLAFVSGVARGGRVEEMFLTAVALAVSAIPEGLPVAVTITLAIGVSRMARRDALIRRLPAVETLGSTTVIGSDKTGTLTQNRMEVERIVAGGVERRLVDGRWHPGHGWPVDPVEAGPAGLDRPFELTLLAGVLSNEASIHHRPEDPSGEELIVAGDPTEVALLVAAERAGWDIDEVRDGAEVLEEVPFEPQRRFAAVEVRCQDELMLLVKGAPERVVEMCDRTMSADGSLMPLDRQALLGAAEELAGHGLRVLALAWSEGSGRLEHGEPSGLVAVGLVGMLDPPRHGVREAIVDCSRAGIRVVMITGDHAITARSIAERLGLVPVGVGDEAVMTGVELAALDDHELVDRIDSVAVFARVAPEDKLRVVRALQARGEVVAVTGDGVNDAPALKAAEIGVAMGRDGTDVAREAADMVLTDDDFVSIAAAVEEGRVTFDNIRKVTFFLVSTGAAEVIAILIAIWLGWPLLFVPAQLLWLNLVTNGLQDVALAFEPGERGVLDRPPRRIALHGGVLSRIMWERTVVAGAVMAAGTLVMFRWQLDRSGSLEDARSVALTTLVAFQVFQAGNSRSERTSILRTPPFSNPFLALATIAAVAVHVAALYLPPTQYVLRVGPIDPIAWVTLIGVASSILVAMEVHKWVRRGSPRL